MPADWSGVLGSDYWGVVRFERRFHLPTGLDADSRVWLVIDEARGQARVSVNGQCLGEMPNEGSHAPPARFEIAPLLKSQNVLSIDVGSPRLNDDGSSFMRAGTEQEAGGLTGLISLEIE